MAKKDNEVVQEDEKTPEQLAELAALETASRPIAGATKRPADEFTMSHQWQAGSPAADSNVLSEHLSGNESILTKIDTPENIKAREEAAEVLKIEDESVDCSKLDVSNPGYCQPGSDRHKAFVKKSK